MFGMTKKAVDAAIEVRLKTFVDNELSVHIGAALVYEEGHEGDGILVARRQVHEDNDPCETPGCMCDVGPSELDIVYGPFDPDFAKTMAKVIVADMEEHFEAIEEEITAVINRFDSNDFRLTHQNDRANSHLARIHELENKLIETQLRMGMIEQQLEESGKKDLETISLAGLPEAHQESVQELVRQMIKLFNDAPDKALAALLIPLDDKIDHQDFLEPVIALIEAQQVKLVAVVEEVVEAKPAKVSKTRRKKAA